MTVVARATPIVCCRPFTALTETQRACWAWQALHQLCHNHIPFTVQRYADIARIGTGEARTIIGEARHLKWLRESEQDLIVGRLAGRRS